MIWNTYQIYDVPIYVVVEIVVHILLSSNPYVTDVNTKLKTAPHLNYLSTQKAAVKKK